jgi:hypothetical protein
MKRLKARDNRLKFELSTVYRPEKIPAVGWGLWCGVGGMFTTRRTRGLLLVGSTT